MDFPGLFSDHIIPEQVHNINFSFVVNNFAKRRGGTAGNTSYTLALLDTPHILFSVAGQDFDEYKKALTKIGVNVGNVKIYKNIYTATGFAMTDKNDNQIWGYFYGASENTDKLKLEKVADTKSLVLIGPQGAKGSMSLVKQCINNNFSYMFDPGFILSDVNDEDLTLGVTNAKYIIGNDYEIALMKKRVRQFSKKIEGKMVITTVAEKGAYIEARGQKVSIKPSKPTKVVDPTGAGDAWRGGFLAGLERGFGMKTSGQMGAVASSFAIEEYGTQEHSFTKNQFASRYKKTYNQSLHL